MKSENWFSRFQEAIIATLSPGDKRAERVSWVGRDQEGCRYIVTDTGNGRWVFKVSDGRQGEPYTARQVAQTEEFIEIKLDTGHEEDVARIYKDKLVFAAKNGPRGWLETASGRWVE